MNYVSLTGEMDQRLHVGQSFDVRRQRLTVAGGAAEASFYSLSGLLNTEEAERLLRYVISAGSREECLFGLPHPEVSYSDDPAVLTGAVMAGQAVLTVEGLPTAAVIDAKNYPLRSVGEPENDRVLRGPRDGFGESLVLNTALIRRRLKDPDLILERMTVGHPAGTDVALCYVEGRADAAFTGRLREKLKAVRTPALNMTQESLAECLIRRGWFNPFPKVRYTERPDAAAAMLEEGSVILVCDNTPQVMILPTSIFDFLQETDDFYLPPLIGTYLRLTRMAIFLLSLILTPIWYCCLKEPGLMPGWLRFIDIREPAAIPLLLQLLLAEFMIDGLKLASLNTPNMLNNSLSVVGGLILGDYAVEAGWFCPQTILYMAIVAIASFTQQSYELGYAFKFMRILLLLAVEVFGVWGLGGGLIFFAVAVARNRTVAGSRSYLYPLIPFNGKALIRVFIRQKRK